jgi:hypothetical protein
MFRHGKKVEGEVEKIKKRKKQEEILVIIE